MKAGVLLIWTGCLLALVLAALHFAFVATPREPAYSGPDPVRSLQHGSERPLIP